MAKGGKKSTLKAALSSHQSRVDINQQIIESARTAERKGKKSKGKASGRPSTIPFFATDKILLVGEGNFSFARALVLYSPPSLEYLPPGNLTATAYDKEEDCLAKYPDAEGIVTTLREKGVEVIFGVDATALEKHKSLKGRKWNRVVWNFPHAGKGITDQDRNILCNQLLVMGFLRSAANILVEGPLPTSAGPSKKRRKPADDHETSLSAEEDTANGNLTNPAFRGTILITLRNVPPYTLWDVPKLAKEPQPPMTMTERMQANPPYVLLRSFVFRRSDWKGYEHRMTKGERAHGLGKTGEGGEDRTWEFCLRDEKSCL